MKTATRLLCSLGLFLGMAVNQRAAITGTVHTIGGSFTPGYVDGDNSVSLFNQPNGLVADAFGRLLIADFNNNVVRSITLADQTTATFATAGISGPIALAITSTSDVLIVNYTAGSVTRVNRDGQFQSFFVAGLTQPTAIAVDSSGNVYVVQQAGTIRRYTSAGVLNQTYSVIQGAPNLRGIALANDGTLAVTDAGNQVIWKLPAAGGSAFLFAGTLGSSGSVDGGVGFGKLNHPEQIASGAGGVLVVADRLNHRVRAVDPSGLLSTLYGVNPTVWEGLPASSLPGWSDGAADQAELREPVGIALDSQNNVYDSEDFYGIIHQASGLTFPTNSAAGGGGGGAASPTDQNRITLGFASGEASSDFVGSGGQRFTAPITLSVVPGTSMYGLQFNLTITNATAGAPTGQYLPDFTSLLKQPDPNHPGVFFPIDAKLYIFTEVQIVPTQVIVGGVPTTIMVTNYIPHFTSLIVTNGTANFIGVGWLERKSSIGTNLYNTQLHDLIRYSAAHDYLFDGTLGRVVVGAVTFKIPPTATPGNQYTVKIGRPSATGDGIATDPVIQTPDGSDPNVPISATRTLNIGSRPYLVGDVLPFRWFNAGDFGDNSILNNDLQQVQEVFAYGFNMPPPGSDMFDAMDSCCKTADGSIDFSSPTQFQFEDSSTLNQIARGDGVITLEDFYVTYRRSLDPSLVNYMRYWSNGVLVAAQTTNSFRGKAGADTTKVKKPTIDMARLEEPVTATFSAANLKATPGQAVHVPVDIKVTGALSVRSISLKIMVSGLDGTPGLPAPIGFTPSTEVGLPTTQNILAGTTFSGIWFESQDSLAAGTHRIGTIDFVMPENANADYLYSVSIDHAEASTGLTRFPVTTTSGVVLMANRAAAPWTDEIPDEWRIKYFGSLMNILSAPDADADGDGMTNLEEYRAGTNPNDVHSALALNGGKSTTGVSLKWPTISGKFYRLESSPSLSGAWTVVEDHISGTGGMIERLRSSNQDSGQFYRVLIVQ